MKKTEEKQAKKTLTRAEKKDAAKSLIKEILQSGARKNLDIIEEAAKLFSERFKSEENENPNDVKGRIGSVLDVMKKEGEVAFDGGMVALKEQILPKIEEKTEEIKAEKTEKKPVAKKRASPKEKEKEEEKKEEVVDKKEEEKSLNAPKQKSAPKKKTAKKNAEEEPKLVETAPQETETALEEKNVPKKRGRKAKIEQESVKKEESAEKLVETTMQAQAVSEEKTEEKKEEIDAKVAEQAEQENKQEENKNSPQGTLMDMSFLLGNIKPQKQGKAEEKKEEKAEEKNKQPLPQEMQQTLVKKQEDGGQVRVQAQKAEQKTEQKAEQKIEQKQEKSQEKAKKSPVQAVKKPVKALSAEEKLQEAFLYRLRRLGGEYFEYYSVYLLEKYSRMNGRRLESLRITAGERDGGIDGEIELTDKLGFRETIYIQAKNWDPSKGDEKLWVVGETLLQQFIGACVCRQAKEGKQHCRGIFITTSRFTPEAKKILNDTSDKFVGYDGVDLYETAKECAFGIVKKNGEWALDEELLSGMKAFYSMQ